MKRKFLIGLMVGALLVACSLSPQLTLIIVSPTPVTPTTPAFTNVIKGKGVSVAVPDTYVSVKTDGLFPDRVLLYAYDKKRGSTTAYGNRANLFIEKIQFLRGKTPLEDQVLSLVEVYKDELDATDIEIKDCVYGNSECVAIEYTYPGGGAELDRCLQYLVKKGADVYSLRLVTYVSEFPKYYDEFSQIFNSFQILEE